MSYYTFKRKQMIETLSGDALTEVEGVPPLTLPQSTGANLDQYKVYGDITQTGTPTPSSPIEIESVGDAILPSEYQQVEYLEGTGTQYIDLGFKATNNTDFEVKFQITDTTTNNFIFGDRVSTAIRRYGLHVQINAILYVNISSDSSHTAQVSMVVSHTDIHIVKRYGTDCYIDNTYKALPTTDTFETQNNIKLFTPTSNDSVVTPKGSEKIFYCKFSENGTPIRNLIPCYRKSDNVAGMYDLVTGTFYTNQGTGDDFTVGPKNTQYKIPIYCFDSQYWCKVDLSSLTWKRYNFSGTYAFYAKLETDGKFRAGLSLKCTKYTGAHVDASQLNDKEISIGWNIGYAYIRDDAYTDATAFTTSLTGLYAYYVRYTCPYAPTDDSIQPTLTNVYLDKPLRKLTNNATRYWADYIDFKNQKVYRYIKEKVFDGTETFVSGTDKTTAFSIQCANYEPTTHTGDTWDRCFSNWFTYDAGAYGNPDTKPNCITYQTRYTRSFMSLLKSEFADTNAFKTYLATQYANGTPLKVYYINTTPTEESVTLPTIPTYVGENYFVVYTNLNASNALVKYYKS